MPALARVYLYSRVVYMCSGRTPEFLGVLSTLVTCRPAVHVRFGVRVPTASVQLVFRAGGVCVLIEYATFTYTKPEPRSVGRVIACRVAGRLPGLNPISGAFR